MQILHSYKLFLKFFICKTRLFLFLLFIFGCTSNLHDQKKITKLTKIQEFILSLSLEERLLLEFFFRSMIQEDVIGYTLLGGKPMSFYSYLKPKLLVNSYRIRQLNCIDRIDLLFEGFNEEDVLFHKGFEVWKKYEHLFCGKNIFFDLIEYDDELLYMKVSVYNKRLMLPLLDHHFNKFLDLGFPIKDKEFLFNLILHDQKFKKKFYSRENLLGICLGYGEKNAELFRTMTMILRSLGRLGFTLTDPSSDRFKKLKDELTHLESFFNGGMKDHRSRKLLFHLGLGFRVDLTDQETINLKEKYTEYYKKLAQSYEHANFLEKTLELIMQADCTKS